MFDFGKAFDVDVLSLGESVGIFPGSFDPSTGLGQAAPIGSLFIRTGTTEVYQKNGVADTDWIIFDPSLSSNNEKILQAKCGPIGQLSGTSIIPLDSSLPQITEGSELWSTTITPLKTTSVFKITSSSLVSGKHLDDDHDLGVVLSVFRDSLCVGSATEMYGEIDDDNTPMKMVSFSIYDAPGILTPITYSVRVGKSASHSGTWYINSRPHLSTPLGNTFLQNAYSIEEIGV